MSCPTGYLRLSPCAAVAVLVTFGLLVAAGIAITFSPLKSGYADAPPRGPGDVELYRAEAERIHAGQGYYAAAADELRPRGYPTQNVFNWRTPLPMWLIGNLPDPRLGKVILGLCGLGLLLLGYALAADEGGVRQGVGCALLLAGALLPCILGDLFVMPELWSGTFLALSACAYGRRLPRLGFVAGLAALFVRELAGPYCALCLIISWKQRRFGEAAAWLAGLAAYAAFFALHAATVAGLHGPQDLAHDHGWIRFGGAAFVISTCQMSAWLLVLPQWITAAYFMLALLGLAGWHSAAGERIGVCLAMYVALFAVVGQPFNQYWGSMFAPLLCFGVARAPASLRDLWRAATRNSRQASAYVPGT